MPRKRDKDGNPNKSSSILSTRDRAKNIKSQLQSDIETGLDSSRNLKQSRSNQFTRLSTASYKASEFDSTNNHRQSHAQMGGFSEFDEKLEREVQPSHVPHLAQPPKKEGKWKQALSKHVHHHQHHAPKEHEKRFSWLDYQHDRKQSVVGRGTNIGSKMGYSVSGRPMLITQAEDLNEQGTSCWEQSWSWDNVMYKFESYSLVIRLFLKKIRGLQVNDMNIKLYGSHKSVYMENLNLSRAEKRNKTWLVHPYSSFRILWDCMMMLLLLIQIFQIPLEIAFKDSGMNKGEGSLIDPFLLMVITDLGFIFDIILTFKTAYLIDKTEVLLNPDEIKKAYLKGWFTVDLVSSVPIDHIMKIVIWFWIEYLERYLVNGTWLGAVLGNSQGSDNMKFFRILKMSKMMRVIKMLRVNRILRYTQVLEQIYENSYEFWSFVFQIISKALLIVVLFLHISACFIWNVAYMNKADFEYAFSWTGNTTVVESYGKSFNEWDSGIVKYSSQFDGCQVDRFGEPSWSKKMGLIERFDEQYLQQGNTKYFWEAYIWSIFRAISNMFCIGYGWEPSANVCDMSVTLVTLSVGAIIFGAMLSLVFNRSQALNVSERIYNNKYRNVTEYMRFRSLPNALQERIYSYYEYRFQGKVFNEEHIMNELNPVLRGIVQHYNQMWLVTSALMFEDCSAHFKNLLCESLHFELYLPGDVLFQEGDRPDYVYFISRGTIRVEVQGESVGRKLDGEILGELCLVFPEHDRVCTAVCESCTHIYQLNLKTFQRIAAVFKNDYMEILKYAKYRIQDEEYFYEVESRNTAFFDSGSKMEENDSDDDSVI